MRDITNHKGHGTKYTEIFSKFFLHALGVLCGFIEHPFGSGSFGFGLGLDDLTTLSKAATKRFAGRL